MKKTKSPKSNVNTAEPILARGNGRVRNSQDGHVYLRAVFAHREKRRKELELSQGYGKPPSSASMASQQTTLSSGGNQYGDKFSSHVNSSLASSAAASLLGSATSTTNEGGGVPLLMERDREKLKDKYKQKSCSLCNAQICEQAFNFFTKFTQCKSMNEYRFRLYFVYLIPLSHFWISAACGENKNFVLPPLLKFWLKKYFVFFNPNSRRDKRILVLIFPTEA